MKTVEQYLASLIPAALSLAVKTIIAIAQGKPDLAARRAEEAARRQAVKLAADAAIAAKKKVAGK